MGNASMRGMGPKALMGMACMFSVLICAPVWGQVSSDGDMRPIQGRHRLVNGDSDVQAVATTSLLYGPEGGVATILVTHPTKWASGMHRDAQYWFFGQDSGRVVEIAWRSGGGLELSPLSYLEESAALNLEDIEQDEEVVVMRRPFVLDGDVEALSANPKQGVFVFQSRAVNGVIHYLRVTLRIGQSPVLEWFLDGTPELLDHMRRSGTHTESVAVGVSRKAVHLRPVSRGEGYRMQPVP